MAREKDMRDHWRNEIIVTEKDAIKMLERLKNGINFEVTDSQKKMDALNMAIVSLKQIEHIKAILDMPVMYYPQVESITPTVIELADGDRAISRDEFIYGLKACGFTVKDGQTYYEEQELIKCFDDLYFSQELDKNLDKDLDKDKAESEDKK